MKEFIKLMLNTLILSVFCAGFAFASNNDMKEHDMANQDKIGNLIHESVIDGYMLSYYFMDLRDKEDSKGSPPTEGSMDMGKSNDIKTQEMEKPNHIMVYIMDKNHKPVMKGKVGFMIAGMNSVAQKSMGMFMSNGFGTTVDMKKKGVYQITTKAVLDEIKLMDKFEYEIK